MPRRLLPANSPPGWISLALASTLVVAGLSACSQDSAGTTASPADSAAVGEGTSTGTGTGLAGTGGTGSVTGTGAASPASTSPASGAATPRHAPTPTSTQAGIRAVLTAFDAMDSHGPYRITLRTDGARAFLDVVPPGSAHYYVTPGTTVGEEIEVDGAVWIRGADGRWTPTDGMTQTAPRLTVADIARATPSGQGSVGGRAYRSYALTGTWHEEALQGTAEIWVDSSQLRAVRLTTASGTTDYTFDYTARPTIAPPAA